MPIAKTPARKNDTRPEKSAPATENTSATLTRVAFVLSLAIVLARATMLEVLRDPLNMMPGSEASPSGPGAGTSLVLDLLAWLPALLVLARATLDRAFVVRLTWAHGLMMALAGWMILSPLWASDKFAAAVSGFHFVSATVFLWSMSQLVRSWRHLRIVAGACVALLLIFGAQALTYRYVDQPEMRRQWSEHREQRLRERGMEPGTFAADQFEAKLLRGEMMGYDASPNTFAATTVLLMVVAAGIVIQRLVQRDGIGWVVLPVVGIVLGACIIVWADSKTAFVTPMVAAGILAALALARGWMANRQRLLYIAGVVGFLAFAAAFVAHGRRHGVFPIDSITFRWHYWVGAARVFAAHPWIGVGWDNFGLHYLAARLPIAAEEVRDPHNFIVRFAAELGAVGAALVIAWMLHLWWELTRPTITPDASDAPARRAVPALATVAVAAMLLSILATIDFAFMSVGGDAGPAYVLLRLIERCIGAGIVVVAMGSVTVRSMEQTVLDDRPAPWVQYAIIAGLGAFFLHNLIDFAMFEIGPMFLFALLAGSALGMRPDGVANHLSRHRLAPLVAVGVLWLAAAGGLVIPVLVAESRAAEGDERLRNGALDRAAQAYHEAAGAVPYNGDYPIREAQVLQSSGGSRDHVRAAYDAAVRANPAHAGYRARRGEFEARLPQPDAAQVRANYDAALTLDPADVAMRLEYAKTLEALGLPKEARAQYERALDYNNQLPEVEVKRLPPAKVAEIRSAIARLGT